MSRDSAAQSVGRTTPSVSRIGVGNLPEIRHRVWRSQRQGARIRGAVGLVGALCCWLVFAAPSAAASAPQNVTAPGISGTPQQGHTLVEVHGVWKGARKVAIQWKDCKPADSKCTPINGASGASYVLQGGDVRRSIVVQETATNRIGSGNARSVPTSPVLPLPPSNTKAPEIKGSVREGKMLTEVPGIWRNARSVDVQWEDCDSSGSGCIAIQGANGHAYVLSAGDVGRSVIVEETATNDGGSSSAKSKPTATIALSKHPPSTTMLSAPLVSVTNEPVRLVAVVTAGSVAPSGSVAFMAAGAPIAGCEALAITPANPAVACTTAFAASGSPERITALFRPDKHSQVTPSFAAAVVTVGQAATATTIGVSSTSVSVGSTATYTAAVVPAIAGLAAPSGAVQFLDGGLPIPACSGEPLTNTGPALAATCTLTYPATGSHSVTASYLGDANFSASASTQAQVVMVHAFGTINATMQWMFSYSRAYTKIRTFVVHGAPVGSTVIVTCTGRRCPYRKRVVGVRSHKRCGKRRCRMQHPGTVDLLRHFHNHPLRPGSRIVVKIVRASWIGKYYVFRIRAGRPPEIRIDCLAPNATVPGVDC